MAEDTSEERDSATPPEAVILSDESPCPNCGERGLDRDEVDVGVGVIFGPYGCGNCRWSEWSEYDGSAGPPPAESDHPGYHADPRGGLTCKDWLDSFLPMVRDA